MKTRDEIQKELDVVLDANVVKKHPYSGFSYLEGYYVINNANRIFGFDGWSFYTQYELMKSFPLPANAKGTKRGMVTLPVSVEVFEDGSDKVITRSSVGTCVWNGEDQIETAIKGAETDGLKRALRMFGKQFGNDLYEKEDSAPTVGTTAKAQVQRTNMTNFNMDPSQKPPVCAKCGSVMSFRTGVRGPFWGCSNYPECKSIVNIDEVDLDGNIIGKASKKASATPPLAAPSAPIDEEIPPYDNMPESDEVNLEDVPF